MININYDQSNELTADFADVVRECSAAIAKALGPRRYRIYKTSAGTPYSSELYENYDGNNIVLVVREYNIGGCFRNVHVKATDPELHLVLQEIMKEFYPRINDINERYRAYLVYNELLGKDTK